MFDAVREIQDHLSWWHYCSKSKEYLVSRRNIIIGIVILLGLCIVGAAIFGSGSQDSETEEESAAVSEAVEEPTEIEEPPSAAEEPEEPESEPTEPEPTPEPTNTPEPTATPEPTPTPEIEGLVKEGTHLVGTDIDPGIYVGLAGEGLFDSCYWARLSSLTGSLDDTLANDNAEGLYYVEVLPDDIALETACDLIPIEQIPARDEYLTSLSSGIYLVGRDIEAGTYRGEAGTDVLDSCYWARLTNVSGALDNIIANDNATGQYFIEVLPTDFALKVSCEVEKVE